MVGNHIWTQPKAALEGMLAAIGPALGDDLLDKVIDRGELTI